MSPSTIFVTNNKTIIEKNSRDYHITEKTEKSDKNIFKDIHKQVLNSINYNANHIYKGGKNII